MVFGAVSSFQVTLLWAMEQANLHIFGTTARASDIRIVCAFVVSAAWSYLHYYLAGMDSKYALVSIMAHGWLCSHNWMCTLGLKVPFRGESENLSRERRLIDLVL